MAFLELSGQTLQDGGLSVTSSRSPEQHYSTIASGPYIQEAPELLKGRPIDSLDRVFVLATEDFEPGTKRISETHNWQD